MFFTSAVAFDGGGARQTISFAIDTRPEPEQFKRNAQLACSSAFDEGGAKDFLSCIGSNQEYDFVGVMHQALLPII